MTNYYVYQWLREDGSPYYIGKGKDYRAWDKRHTVNKPTDPNNIQIIKEDLSEKEAFELEKELIKKYGRKDIGTGILRNLTNGGEGSSGYRHGDTAKEKITNYRKNKKSSLETRKKLQESWLKRTEQAKRECFYYK